MRPDTVSFAWFEAGESTLDLASSQHFRIDISTESRHEINSETSGRQLYIGPKTMPGMRRNRKVNRALLNNYRQVAPCQRQVRDALYCVNSNRAFETRHLDWPGAGVDRHVG